METAGEQLNLFAVDKSAEEKIYDAMRPTLERVMEQNGLPIKWVSLRERQGYYAVSVRGSIVLRIASGKKLYLDLPSDGSAKNFRREKMDTVDEVSAYLPAVADALQRELNAIKTDYDCCSRYEACSDAKRCVHPDPDFAVRCSYRKVLQSGRVFYGKNRNI